ncbi:radical SAM protein [Burkholderia cepacia]|uniref:radical SAM protein n=1 Tax=Burkholderia cepacia TaxID=292 RepID=UPI00158992FC|nr:radical SAM protein [Burkholderia cepacia]
MNAIAAMSTISLKASLLADGIRISQSARRAYGPPYLIKRRAYGNADQIDLRDAPLPQELYLGSERLICAANFRIDAPWLLNFTGGKFFIQRVGADDSFDVDFPKQPPYYDLVSEEDFRVSKVVTLYGGGALGVFVYGDCSLVTMRKPCQYCSIEPNRKRAVDFLSMTSPEDVELAVYRALSMDDGTITQVMLNGGNLPDLDKSFGYYLRIAEAARKAVDRAGRKIPIHLIAFPPDDLGLIRHLSDLNVAIAFNSEVHDSTLFERYCPGKAAIGGQALLRRALERAASVLVPGSVFSIFVGGLESVASLTKGLREVAEIGATPVVNVFHADPETPLANHPCPSREVILEMGSALQSVYTEFHIKEPFYSGCGRNSLDSEAFDRRFH